jgi:hypothetical protein
VDVQQGGSAKAVSTASSERASSRLHDAGSDDGHDIKSSGHEAMRCDGSGEVLGKLGAVQQGQCSVTMAARSEKGGCRSAGRGGCRVLASWVGETVEGEDGGAWAEGGAAARHGFFPFSLRRGCVSSWRNRWGRKQYALG